jgi:hypothetical protein
LTIRIDFTGVGFQREASRTMEDYLAGSIQVERLESPEPQPHGSYNTQLGETEDPTSTYYRYHYTQRWSGQSCCRKCFTQRSVNGRCNCDY